MANYGYIASERRWVDIEKHDFWMDRDWFNRHEEPLSDEIIYNLENNDRAKKYIVFDNSSGGIYAGLMQEIQKVYVDIDDAKLVLKNGLVYFTQTSEGSSGRFVRSIESIVNKDIINMITEDPEAVLDYIDNFLYLTPIDSEDRKFNKKRHKKGLESLTTDQRLIYELLGSYPGNKD